MCNYLIPLYPNRPAVDVQHAPQAHSSSTSRTITSRPSEGRVGLPLKLLSLWTFPLAPGTASRSEIGASMPSWRFRTRSGCGRVAIAVGTCQTRVR